MKYFIFLFLFIPGLLAAKNLQAENSPANRKSADRIVVRTICEPIGQKGEQLDLCVDNYEGTEEYYQVDAYYLKSSSGRKDLNIGGGFCTFKLMASPDRNYIVIEECAGEGHAMFSVANLDDIRANKEQPAACGGLDDLSGYSSLKWQGEILYFEATADLLAGQRVFDGSDRIYRYRLFPADHCRLVQLGSSMPD